MSKRSFSQQFDDGLLNASLSDNTFKKDSDYTKATKNSKQKKKQKLT